ncbi:MAG TPA: histidine phosphatase family protein [Bryobacteraceae bacterium]|nr:histidine phosphatase family protein [Bryobacteraceae bacterium]HOL72452.1 histidine phosphatase family protein [Bryobacteraceae bacterium]HOQ46968.1 histidine phosphatase family protein [Bryobacteraceae bacterium]HPQ14991.1 histidine phosphatase family protein [Bryobacteraceae bacterium]HPU73105.1 histidine phosphatase family protein [Bryobacteraceae bacterium]
MATLVFIRHAACDSGTGSAARLCGWYDVPLTPLGCAQTERLREWLRMEPTASAVYSSTLRRAAETARAAPLEPLPADSLREINCGVLDGRPLEEIRARHPELWRRNLAQNDEDFNWLGGESYRQFRRRVLEAVSAIAANHKQERVLIFTHAGVISQVLGALAGVSAARWEDFRPGYASITEIDWNGGSPTVRRYDDRSHLGPLAVDG